MSYEINSTTAQITKKLRDNLNLLKKPKETVNDVILRLYTFYIENNKEK